MTGTTSGTVTVGADKSIPVAAVIPTNTGGNNGNSSEVIMSTNKAANITVNSAQVTGTINSDGIETYDGADSFCGIWFVLLGVLMPLLSSTVLFLASTICRLFGNIYSSRTDWPFPRYPIQL